MWSPSAKVTRAAPRSGSTTKRSKGTFIGTPSCLARDANSHPCRTLTGTSGGAQIATLDGRSFVFVPYDSWGRTKAYELMPDGKAVMRFDTVGDVFKWIRVR